MDTDKFDQLRIGSRKSLSFKSLRPLVANSISPKSRISFGVGINRDYLTVRENIRTWVFLLAAWLISIVCSTTFLIIRNYEATMLESTLRYSSHQLAITIVEHLTIKMNSMKSLQVYLNNERSRYSNYEPQEYLKGFVDSMAVLKKLTEAEDFNFYPSLTNTSLNKWNQFVNHTDSFILSPLADQNTRINTVKQRKTAYIPVYVSTSATPQLIPISFSNQSDSNILKYEILEKISSVYSPLIFDTSTNNNNINKGLSSTSKLKPKQHSLSSIFSIITSLKDNKDNNQNITYGIGEVKFSWEKILSHSLPDDIPDLHCVISSQDSSRTFVIHNGVATLLDYGDVTDKNFITSRVNLMPMIQQSDLLERSLSGFSIDIYLTNDFYQTYITDTPAYVCGAILVIIVMHVFIVGLYDVLLLQREKELEREIEDNRKQFNSTLHELENKKNFVRHISHEIRTPLSTIKMGLEVLLKDTHSGVDRRDLEGTIGEIGLSCEAALEVVNDFLLFDKINTQGLQLELQRMNILKLVDEAVKPFRVQARQKEVMLRLVNNLPPAELCQAFCDKAKVTQVIRNLVSNALKFTPRNGRVLVKISKGPSEAGGKDVLMVEVTDTGAGISHENQAKLFQSVIQFNPGKLQDGGGSGLGLYISYNIMKRHGGKIKVHSDGEGCGSTFTMTIPIMQEGMTSEAMRLSLLLLDIPDENNNNLNMQPITPLSIRSPLSHRLLGEGKAITGNGGTTNTQAIIQLLNDSFRERSNYYSKGIFLPTRISIYDENGEKSQSLHHSESRRSRQLVLSNTSEPKDSIRNSGHISTQKIRILIVDDAASNRKMLIRMIMNVDEGFCCEEVGDGLLAVERIRDSTQWNGSRHYMSNSSKKNNNPIDNNNNNNFHINNNKNDESGVENKGNSVDDDLDDKNHPTVPIEAMTVSTPSHSSGFQAIFIDYNMPKMNGPDAVETLRGIGYCGVIVGMTGYADHTSRETFIQHGADLVVVKPMDAHALLTILQPLLLGKGTN